METKGNQRMLSNGLHGQRYHSLTVFVPTIKCPHYCQLAQHLYPERHHEHMGCHQGHRESCLERRESCLERRDRERERELYGAQREREHRGRRYLGLFTAGLRLVFCSAGKVGLVTTSATAGFLRLVFSSGWLGRAG